MRIRPTGDNPRYGDRRGADRRRLAKHQDRRSGKERRQSWPGSGRSFRKRNEETGAVRVDGVTLAAVWLSIMALFFYDVATSEIRTIVIAGMICFSCFAIFGLAWRRYWKAQRAAEDREKFAREVRRNYVNRGAAE